MMLAPSWPSPRGLLYLLHLLRISFTISFKIRSFESIDYDEVKEMKAIFGDNKIMYQFSEVKYLPINESINATAAK